MTALANHFNPTQENARQADGVHALRLMGAMSMNPHQRREMADTHQKRQDAAKRVRE
jgi:hypothetical protein